MDNGSIRPAFVFYKKVLIRTYSVLEEHQVTRSITVFIVEDDPLLLRTYVLQIDREPGFCVVGSAFTGPEAIEKIPRRRPDLVLVDISLVGMNGIELIKHIRAIDPSIKTLVVTGYDDVHYAERSLKAGARGYLLKQEMPAGVFAAMSSVLNGRLYLSESIRIRLLQQRVFRSDHADDQSILERLTDRELEVFSRLGNGLSKRDIADYMFISLKTVETYLNNIRKKLQLASLTELRQVALRHVGSERKNDS